MKTLRSRVFAVAVVAGSMGLTGCASTQEVKKPVEQMTAAPRPPPEPTAEEHEYAGVQALKAGDTAAAKDRFAKALAKNPKLVAANYNQAFLAQKDGDLDAAAKGYEAVLAQDPDHEQAL
ncbi:MAG: tetratricopeptide repeat protein, partial [Myxococcales bacterium]